MTRKAKAHPDKSSLEERFEFVGDAVAPGDQRALKSTLYEVEDRLTGVSRCLKLWRKTGAPVDEDLRRLWKHEMRQLQRVMAYAGARDVIVDVLEFVEDSENFGVLLENAGAPLAARRRRVGPNHWFRNVTASRSRVLIWRNVRRLVTALGIVHAQGLVHGKLSADVIMTEASDEPDFQLGGFEWSLWVSADSADKAHAALGPEGSAQRAGIYSFAEDWRALGHVVAECLGAKIKANGEMVAVGDVNLPINVSASERALLKRMVMPARLDHLDADSSRPRIPASRSCSTAASSTSIRRRRISTASTASWWGAAYQEPWRLLAVDSALFGQSARYATPKAAAEALIPYIERELGRGARLRAITRHVLGLPGARAFRRHLATEAVKPGAAVAAFRAALDLVVDKDAQAAHTAAA